MNNGQRVSYLENGQRVYGTVLRSDYEYHAAYGDERTMVTILWEDAALTKLTVDFLVNLPGWQA